MMASFNEDPGRSAPGLVSSFALQFPGMSQSPVTQASVILNRPEKRLRFPDDPRIIRNVRQRLYRSLVIRKD